MENNTQCTYPHLLNNQLRGKDLFENKSHENIAKQIANLLQSDSSVHTIGIDGSWGSGKSNLVKIVEEQLDSNKYHFLRTEELLRRTLFYSCAAKMAKTTTTCKSS